MGKKKILIVDNEPEVVKGFEIRLKHWGYDVLVSFNADECFKIVEKEHPDLVLLDVLMPGLDGVTACSRLRSSYGVPVIMVTALDDTVTRHDASLFGAFEYVTKPIDEGELKSKIEKALSFHQQKT
jgi:DNA-binding response OmpR family regulator